MPIVTDIRRNEVVAGHGVVRKVRGELGEGPDVGDTVSGSGVICVRHVVKENKRIVLRSIVVDGGKRAGGAADVLLVGLPGNVGVLQERHEMTGRALVVGRGIVVVEYPEIGAGL